MAEGRLSRMISGGITLRSVTVFAPASIGNIGPGFDVLGVAITNCGDEVTAARKRMPGVEILEITGAGVPLPEDAAMNTAGIAAMKALRAIDADMGMTLRIKKGVPVASVLGSSAASAVAGGFAANRLFGDRLKRDELLQLCTEAEAAVSGGFFADNTAAALFGGGTITRSNEPLDVISMGGLPGVTLVMVTPAMALPTAKARKALPKKVDLHKFVSNMGNTAAIVAAFAKKDADLFCRSINDIVVEPARARLIPGFYDVKAAALDAGALGCSISGAGPTVFAAIPAKGPADKVGQAMKKAFLKNGLKSTVQLCSVDRRGAREV